MPADILFCSHRGNGNQHTVKRRRMGLRCDSLNSQSLKVFCSSVCVAEADGVGLAGAIVKMARDGLGAAAEQPGPHGATVYYIVESLEMVSSSTCCEELLADQVRRRNG